MSRRDVAILAGRAAALWLIVSGLAGGVSLVAVPWPPEAEQALLPTVLILGVLPIATGLLLWTFSDPIAGRVFRDKPADGAPTTFDLYRVASAFAGLLLIGGTVPRLALWLSAFALSFQTRSSLLGPVGLQAEQRYMLFDVQTRAAAISTAVQFALGLVLVVVPERVERLLASLRRESVRSDARPSDDSATDQTK